MNKPSRAIVPGRKGGMTLSGHAALIDVQNNLPYITVRKSGKDYIATTLEISGALTLKDGGNGTVSISSPYGDAPVPPIPQTYFECVTFFAVNKYEWGLTGSGTVPLFESNHMETILPLVNYNTCRMVIHTSRDTSQEQAQAVRLQYKGTGSVWIDLVTQVNYRGLTIQAGIHDVTTEGGWKTIKADAKAVAERELRLVVQRESGATYGPAKWGLIVVQFRSDTATTTGSETIGSITAATELLV